MKIKHLFLSLLAVAAVAAVSCKKEDTGKASIEISPEELSFESGESTQTVSVTSNRTWKIDNEDELPSWITVDKKSATEAAVTVKANKVINRTCEVVFKAGIGAKKTLAVSQKGEMGTLQDGDGTEAKPYTASQALAETSKLEQGKTATTESYYVIGQIVKIKEVSTKYGNATFYISNDGTATNQYTIYQCYYAGGAKFTDETKDAIKAGDIVVVKGPFVNYYDSEHSNYGVTPEMKGGQIVSINGEVPAVETPEYEKAEAKTVKEFIEAADTATYFKLTGTISSVINSSYLAFNLTDETGTIYVYGPTNKTTTAKSDIKNKGKVTLSGKYKLHTDANTQQTKVEVTKGYILSYEAGVQEKKTVTGVVVAVSSMGFLIKTESSDNNGIVYAYDKTVKPDGIKVGDNVTVNGIDDEFNGVPEITGYTFTINSHDNEVTYPNATEITKDNIASYTDMFGYVKATGTLSVSGSYYNLKIDGATLTGSISYPVSGSINSALNGKKVDVAGYFVGLSGTSSNYFNILMTSISPSGSHFLVTPTAMEVKADSTSAEINIMSSVAWTAASATDGFTLDKTSGEGNATIKVTFAANTDTKNAKTAKITITTADTNIAEAERSVTVTITQSKASSGNELTIVLDVSKGKDLGDLKAGDEYTTTQTTTIDGYSWTFVPANAKVKIYGTYLMFGKMGAYVLMPAVEGKSLTKVTILTSGGISGSAKLGVYDAKGTNEVSGGEAISVGEKNKEYSWELKGTTANTSYQLRVCSAYNVQLQKLTLIYE